MDPHTFPIAKDVKIDLKAGGDVDVQVYDPTDKYNVYMKKSFDEGRAIIGWCGDQNVGVGCNLGILNGQGDGEEMMCTNYGGAEYCYIGYDGFLVNGARDPGYESIEIRGTTDRPIMFAAYGYVGGNARISYTFWHPEDPNYQATEAPTLPPRTM